MSESRMIPITNVQLHEVGDSGSTKAIGSVTIGEAFVAHGVRVVESEKGLFVAMPQRRIATNTEMWPTDYFRDEGYARISRT